MKDCHFLVLLVLIRLLMVSVLAAMTAVGALQERRSSRSLMSCLIAGVMPGKWWMCLPEGMLCLAASRIMERNCFSSLGAEKWEDGGRWREANRESVSNLNLSQSAFAKLVKV